MLFTLKELVRWLGMTAFEIWLSLVSWLVFTVLVVLKQHSVLALTWWHVFSPLFSCDALSAYFCVIVFIRTYRERLFRAACVRLVSSVISIVCLLVFKLLLCQKLSHSTISYSEVTAPLFILLQALMVKACQVY